MNNPLVSVWMITYNQENYISQALDSVLMQKTDFDYEIVIGEDCSTDNTRMILEEYKNKYQDKIRLILNESNIGMIANQNKTFKACQGEYIAMLEGDDFWIDEYKLQKQVDKMKKYPNCNISFHPVKNTNKQIVNFYSNKEEIFSVEKGIKIGGYFCSTPSIMIKKEVVFLLPDFLNDAPAGDFYIQIFGSLKGGYLYIPDIMSVYRLNAESSWSKSIQNHDIQTNFIEKTLEKILLMDRYLEYKYYEAFSYRYQTASITLALSYLHHGNTLKFSRTIERVIKLYKKNLLKIRILYILKRFPKLAFFLTKTNQNFKIYLRKIFF